MHNTIVHNSLSAPPPPPTYHRNRVKSTPPGDVFREGQWQSDVMCEQHGWQMTDVWKLSPNQTSGEKIGVRFRNPSWPYGPYPKTKYGFTYHISKYGFTYHISSRDRVLSYTDVEFQPKLKWKPLSWVSLSKGTGNRTTCVKSPDNCLTFNRATFTKC